MSIKIKNPIKQEPVTFDSLHLESFKFNQPVKENTAKEVYLRTYLTGHTDVSNEWKYNKESRWEFNTDDFDKFALQMYMEKTGKTMDEALVDYAAALEKSKDATILEAMAYFQRGIALLYEYDNKDKTDVV